VTTKPDPIPRRVYLFTNRDSKGSIYSGATHERDEAQTHADNGALVVEYGKVGILRATK
jgi:hypothetical protein